MEVKEELSEVGCAANVHLSERTLGASLGVLHFSATFPVARV